MNLISNLTSTRLLALLWLGMPCIPALALEIGPLRWVPTSEAVGAHAEITVGDTNTPDGSAVGARLARREAYSVAGLRYHPGLESARVTVREASRGQVAVWIEGLPPDEATLDLLLVVNSPTSLGLVQYQFSPNKGAQTISPSPAGTHQATHGLSESSAGPIGESVHSSGATSSAPDVAFSDAQAALQSWAQAWSRQDVDAYLAAYTDAYAGVPAQPSHADWMLQRRTRILAAKNIVVALKNLQAQRQGNRIICTFDQHYHSSQYSDVTRKRVVLVQENGHWRIQNEVSIAPTP
jgi:ketosteroid isomerase-like protein